jgi:acetyl-CoA carboxylase carboxyltransferase component
LWVDAIIDPVETRKILALGIAMANHAKPMKRYNVGAIQT